MIYQVCCANFDIAVNGCRLKTELRRLCQEYYPRHAISQRKNQEFMFFHKDKTGIHVEALYIHIHIDSIGYINLFPVIPRKVHITSCLPSYYYLQPDNESKVNTQ